MKIKNILSIAILLIIIAFAAYYVNDNIHDFSDIKLVNPWFIAPVVLLLLAGLYIQGLQNKNLLTPFGVNLRSGEEFSLAIVTRFYNLITPFRGGMAARAVYLKKKHKFPYTNFMATLAASYVLIFLVASTLGIISTILIYYTTGIFSWILFVVFDVVFIGMIGIMVVSPKFAEPENKWLRRFVTVINGWHLIKHNKRVIAVTILITFVQIMLGSVMLWLQFRVFGISVGFVPCLFLSSIGNLSILVGITPGNLGIGEAITVFSALTIGITPAQSLSAALLGRAVSLVVLFILGPIFSYVLMRKGRNSFDNGSHRNTAHHGER